MFKGVTGYGEEYNQGLHIFFGYKISTAVIPAPQDNQDGKSRRELSKRTTGNNKWDPTRSKMDR